MVDVILTHRPALAEARSGSFGATGPADRRMTLIALPEGHILQVVAGSGAGDLRASLGAFANNAPFAVRRAGPGQWFVVGDTPVPAQALSDARDKLAANASIADQSHGRVRIGVSGGPVEVVLAKGTAVDLDINRFPTGSSAITLMGHISVHLTRTGDKSFELLVLRGFAGSLWDELIRMSLEFGVDARTT